MNYKGYKHIRWEQRLKIEGALRTGAKPAAIAQELGVCKKTIYNEIERGMCVQQTSEYEFVERYCADVAERKYQENLRAKGPDIIAIIRIGGIQLGEELFQLPKPQKRRKP